MFTIIFDICSDGWSAIEHPISYYCRYVNGKVKTWKERIKTNFHGQDVPYNTVAMQQLC